MMSLTYRTFYDEKTKTWSGPRKNYLYNKNVTIGEVILNELEKDPNKIGQISDHNGIHMTNGDIRLKSVRAAQNLLKLGYKQKDVFAFYTKNGHNLAPIVFGSLTIGAAINGLDPNFKKDEILHICRQTNPALVFCDIDNYETMQEALKELPGKIDLYVFDGTVNGLKNTEELFKETGTESIFTPPTIEDAEKHVATIVCTSGTTGLAKGVCISHASLLYKPNMLSTSMNDVILCFASLYWVTGLAVLLTSTILGVKRIITTERFTPGLMISLIEKYKVTTTMSAPAILGMMLQWPTIKTTDLSSMRLILCGGGVLHLELINQLQGYMPNVYIGTGYGTSEAVGGIAGSYPEYRDGAVGHVTAGMDIQIIDDDNKKCGPNENGEVCIRSPYNFLGYINNEQATKESYNEDGYILTGDIGHFDSDGFLFLVDRKKEIIKFQSKQVSPQEIENLIIGLKGVKAVCVVGVPDKVDGDLPAAVIVKSADSNLKANDVHAIIKEKLVDDKQLRGGVYFVDNLPMTSTGKFIRGQVKQIAIELFAKK